MKRKKLILYTAFFVVLILGFYLALNLAIPGYGKTGLPVLSNVQPFEFTDQFNQKISERDMAGKVYVAEFFFTTCKGICPRLNTNMRQVYEKFKDNSGFAILSHTVDPETDSVGRLKVYADSLGITGNHWLFLTGRKDSLYKAARLSYLLDDPKNGDVKIEDQFIHTQLFALVDKSGRVRKIYDGLEKKELQELEEDIPALLNEKAGAQFANGLFNNNPN